MSERARIEEILDEHHVVHLATVGDGGAHAAPLFYVRMSERLRIAWVSSLDSRHSCEIGEGCEVAASVSPSAPSLGSYRGLQLAGWARPAEDAGLVEETWYRRFPETRGHPFFTDRHRWYTLEIRWARIVEVQLGERLNAEWSAPANGI